MSNKSLPAYLQQVLRAHVEQSDLRQDEELNGIMEKLSDLNTTVESIKRRIMERRLANGEDN